MNWILAGAIAGVGAYLSDWLMWGKVFTKGMEGYHTPMSPDQMKAAMPVMMVKSFVIALVYGILLALFYRRFAGGLWVQGGGPLAGMEFATILWLCTVALATLGSGIWYDKVRTLHMAMFWAWLARSLVAGLLVGILVK
jgi:hypothetical protein